MQNNTDPMNKTKEIPEVQSTNAENNVRTADVHEDQQSMFDAEQAFSESMVVEKNDVEIGTEQSFDGGDTAVFNFPVKEEKQNDEVSVKELQGTAKDYFDATHSDSIEDKVNELCRLADEGFDDDMEEDASAEEAAAPAVSEIKPKKNRKEKKKKRRGIISDDDIEMLSGELPAVETHDEEIGADIQNFQQDNGSGIEYTNPLGTDDSQDETEEDKLIKALGGHGKHFKSFDSVFGDDEPEVEYTDRNQEESILKGLRSNAILSMISVVLTVIAAAFCIYFEAAAGTKLAHPAVFEAGKFGVTYSMCMLQLMFLCVIFNFDGMKRAFKGLRPSKPSAEGFCAAAVVVCTLHSIVSVCIASDSPELKSFCSVGCVSLVMLSINSFIKAQTSLSAFCIAASRAPKLSSVDLDRDSEEAAAFEKYLEKDTTIFTVGRSDFVSGFFKKTTAVPSSSKNTFKIVLIVAIVALLAAAVCTVLSDLYAGVCAFAAICLAAFPVNALLSTALPFFAASSRAKKTQTAFIGEAACDAYESAGVVSFDDTEVFPAKSVKVSSIRTYSDNRIDKVILYMARVFDKVQGPLSYVFANSVQSLEDSNVEAQIVEHFSNGISAKADGREILVGNESFMKLYDIETPVDNIDESFTRSLGSIMYMAVDGGLAAKFYVKYTVSRGFESLLHAFYDAGICVGIKTLDPSITTDLVCGNLKGSNYPVAVIRKRWSESASETAQETGGAVISLSGVHNFLKGFIRLDNLRNVYRSNSIISLFCSIIGAVIAAFLSVTGMFEIGVVMLVVFQLLWCVPTVLFSAFSK